jgi:GNAT superfamily N-acetyltransferase
MGKIDPEKMRGCDFRPIDVGYPGYFRAFDLSIRKDPMGWAVVVVDDNRGCMILDVWVDEDYRRQGFGKMLIAEMQGAFERVWTGLSSKAGRELCLKMGFTLARGHYKKDIPKLVWEAKRGKQ